ncbi:MAG: site-specific integrase, partial [Lysinibacillus sp.]|nr:site-specific integrase [Lysinibacillus sp.]
LLSSGVDVAVVADRLGNTPNVIWETYAHVISESKSRTVDQFISALKTAEK